MPKKKDSDHSRNPQICHLFIKRKRLQRCKDKEVLLKIICKGSLCLNSVFN